MRLHIDFETRSTVDLRVSGAYRYAEDPQTEVIMACYAIDEGPVQTWLHTQPLPDDLRAALEDENCIVVAHNAGFEKAMLTYILGPRHGWPVPHPFRWDDTAARAARQALPRSLDGAASALGLDVQKDAEGRSLMLRMCRPRSVAPDGAITWWEDDARMTRLAQYCATDVEVERQLDKALRPLTDEERKVWLLTETMNDRGVSLDVPFATYAVSVAMKSQEKLNEELNQITDGVVPAATNVGKLRQWLLSKGFGILEGEDESLNKKAVENLLKSGALPDEVKRALEIRLLAGKSSVKKFQAMLDRVSKDGRVRGNLMYHGASTGRWSGAGVQLQNLPRDTVKDFDWSRKNLEASTDKALSTLSRMVRGSITAAPGHRLMWADYAAVEARGVAWLAGQADLVELFANGGKVYEEMAGVIFDMNPAEVGKDSLERFLGKTVILGCFEADTPVLTKRGWVPIIYLQPNDLLWDGIEWVTHQGVLDQGVKTVHRRHGIGATPDHAILTEHGWREWKEVHTTPSLLKSATKLVNLPFYHGNAGSVKTAKTLDGIRYASVHADGVAQSFVQTLSKGVQHVVARAQGKLAQLRENAIWATQTFSPMTTTENAYLLGSQPASVGVTTQIVNGSTITEGVASRFMNRGEKIVKNFYGTCSRYLDGMFQNWKLIASTTTRGMNRVIYGSLLEKITWEIGERLANYKTGSIVWKKKSNVYDIYQAGPRNRFTILTSAGPLIVHNCGYSMGAQKFRLSCAAMGTDIDEELAYKAVNAYRSNYAKIPRLWKMLEEAAIAAVAERGRETVYRQVAFFADKHWLLVRLPSGRKLFYHRPRLVTYAGPYGERVSLEYMAVNSMTKKWGPERTFGGKLTENIVQGLCRDLIADAMLRLEEQGYPVIASVHDEVISEVPLGEGTVDEMVRIMCELPEWAKDFPLAAEGKESVRYGK